MIMKNKRQNKAASENIKQAQNESKSHEMESLLKWEGPSHFTEIWIRESLLLHCVPDYMYKELSALWGLAFSHIFSGFPYQGEATRERFNEYIYLSQKYSTTGFMLREWNWKSWWSINNLSQSIRYDSRLYTLNLCRSAARILPLRQASSQMNNEQTLEDRDLMQKSLSPCHAAALKDSPPLPRFVKFFYLPFFFLLPVALLWCQGVKSNKDGMGGSSSWGVPRGTSSP